MAFTVRQARRLCEKTQSEMAKEMNMCRDSYRKIEENPEKATVAQAREISRITGIPLDKIFFGSDIYLK